MKAGLVLGGEAYGTNVKRRTYKRECMCPFMATYLPTLNRQFCHALRIPCTNVFPCSFDTSK